MPKKKSRDARTNRIPSRASVSDVLAAPILDAAGAEATACWTRPARFTRRHSLEAGGSGARLSAADSRHVTLSGATMSDAGAWLEVDGDGAEKV